MTSLWGNTVSEQSIRSGSISSLTLKFMFHSSTLSQSWKWALLFLPTRKSFKIWFLFCNTNVSKSNSITFMCLGGWVCFSPATQMCVFSYSRRSTVLKRKIGRDGLELEVLAREAAGGVVGWSTCWCLSQRRGFLARDLPLCSLVSLLVTQPLCHLLSGAGVSPGILADLNVHQDCTVE